ncbi:MAG TPA: toll/interleukin-1 receptor domain-containing protein [Saprospiraceae bacterium]|nr:toll/interleukin-1 receptor domain-containing protein [Saprospiraceae bacterium]
MKEFEKFNNFFIEQGLIKYSDDLLKTLFRVIKKSDYKNYFSIERVLPLTLSEKSTIYNEIKLELTSFFIQYDMFDNKISTNPFSIVLKEYTEFILTKNDKCEFVENLILDLKYCLLENKELEIELIEADGGYRGKKETQRFDLKIQIANLYLNELRLNKMDRVTHLFLDLCRNSFKITFLENQLSEFKHEKDRIMYINYIMNEFEKKQIYDWMRTIEIYNETGKLYGYDDLSSELGTFGFCIADPNEEISFNETTYGMKLEMCLNDFIRQCERLLNYPKQQLQTKAKSEIEPDVEIKLINNKNMEVKKEKQNVMICYSKQDLELVNAFRKELIPLEDMNFLNKSWYCTLLVAGEKWDDKIKEQLYNADLIFFMCSSNLTANKYVKTNEITYAKENAKTIVPIILSFCQWETYLGDYTALPYTGKPIIDFKDQSMAWYLVIEGIKLMLSEEPELDLKLQKLFERIIKGKVDNNS